MFRRYPHPLIRYAQRHFPAADAALYNDKASSGEYFMALFSRLSRTCLVEPDRPHFGKLLGNADDKSMFDGAQTCIVNSFSIIRSNSTGSFLIFNSPDSIMEESIRSLISSVIVSVSESIILRNSSFFRVPMTGIVKQRCRVTLNTGKRRPQLMRKGAN